MSDDLTPPNFDFEDVLAANTSTGDPVLDELTWERLGVDLNHPAGDVPMPGEQPTEPSAPLPPKGSIAGPKVSVGTRGMTDAGIKRAKGVFGEADARITARAGELETEKDAQIAKSREHYAAVGEAFDLAIEKTREFQQREQELQQQVIAFNQQAAELEQRMAAQAQAERAAYLAEYKEQLALIKQLSLQSGNPMGQLSRAEAIGLAGAQFAQGFLAAQGVNIDVAGQVDRWVERSIAEHQMKIQNARTAAQDTLHLYEIARQNSQDEWEARQRYRGFVIAGLQAAIHLNASRFQSDIAIARATEQIARLQVEADATERAISDAHFARINQIYQSEYQRAYQMGQLSIEQRKIALDEAKVAWDMDPRNPKNQGEAPLTLPAISDPEELGPDGKPLVDANGNKILRNRWVLNRKIQDPVLARQVWSDAAKAREDYKNYLNATNALIEAYNKAKPIYDQVNAVSKMTWGELDRLTDSPEVHEFMQALDSWAMAKVYAVSGKAATNEEFARVKSQAYKDMFLARNANKGEVSHAKLREEGRKAFESHMESFGFEAVPENDQFQRTPTASPRTAAEDEAIIYGKKPEPGLDEKLLGQITARDSENIRRPLHKISGAWADFKGAANLGEIEKGSAEMKKYANEAFAQPEWSVATELLAASVVAPNTMWKQAEGFGVKVRGAKGEVVNEQSPYELRQQAYKALSSIARGETPSGRPVSADTMEWASYLKNQIDNDPQLSALLNEGGDPNAKGFDVTDATDSELYKRLVARPGEQ
jgi:hypothetical protein